MKVSSYKSKEALLPSELIINENGSVYHLGIRPGDLADNVIVVGDPDRVTLISSRFDTIELKHINREFCTHTGVYNGKRITVISSGIGVDNIDILMNELDILKNVDLITRKVKVKTSVLNIIRIGTCGSLQEDIPPGTFICSRMALGMEGLPFNYNCEFEENEKDAIHCFREQVEWSAARADPYLVLADQRLCDLLGEGMEQGITCTANGFYGPQGRSIRLSAVSSADPTILSNFVWNNWRMANLEMECSGIYALGGALGHRCCTLTVVLANRVTGMFHADPQVVISDLVDLTLNRLTH